VSPAVTLQPLLQGALGLPWSDEPAVRICRGVGRALLITVCLDSTSVTVSDIFSTRSPGQGVGETLRGPASTCGFSSLCARHGEFGSGGAVGFGYPTSSVRSFQSTPARSRVCEVRRPSLARTHVRPTIRRTSALWTGEGVRGVRPHGEPRDPKPRITLSTRARRWPQLPRGVPNTTAVAIPAAPIWETPCDSMGKEEKPFRHGGSLLGGPAGSHRAGEGLDRDPVSRSINKPTWSATFGANIRDTRPLSLTRGGTAWPCCAVANGPTRSSSLGAGPRTKSDAVIAR
jgi:hypothetical protein